MATNFVLYRTRSLGAKVSQDPLDRFSQSLHHMVGIELQMINPSFLTRDVKNVAMATNLVAKWGQNYLPCTYRSLIPKRNRILLPQCARLRRCRHRHNTITVPPPPAHHALSGTQTIHPDSEYALQNLCNWNYASTYLIPHSYKTFKLEMLGRA